MTHNFRVDNPTIHWTSNWTLTAPNTLTVADTVINMVNKPIENVQVVRVRTEEDLEATIYLFHEYIQWLDLDLAFQGLDVEMSSMPGKYAPPRGELLLAKDISCGALGCVAIRPLSEQVCEMKRLYVVNAAKGLGIGRRLVTAVIKIAFDIGYQEIRLDTLPRMTAALAIYRSCGFVEIPAYYNTPLPDTHFLSLDLSRDNADLQTRLSQYDLS